MHEEVLNFMMANTCHNKGGDNPGDATEFTFDLHCVEVAITAQFVGNWEEDDVRYEIVSWSAKAI